MVAVNLRFEDLRARDNQRIDREFFNRRYRLIAEAIAAIADEVDGIASDSDNLVSLGLVRVNEVLGPLLAKVQAASEEGFLVAASTTSVQLSVGLETTFDVTAGWQRDLFQPTPYVMLTRSGGNIDDWALFKVTTYNRDNGGLAGQVVAVSGTIDAAAHSDWVISATAGIAKAVMEQAAAAQVAIDAAQAAAAAAEQAATDAEAVLASGPVASVNGQTGAVALGMADIPNLISTLGGKAASSHAHPISDVTGLQAALDGKTPTGHGHAISDVTGLQAALDAAGGGNAVLATEAMIASAGDVIFADTSSGGFTVTLPATPGLGDTVVFVDDGGNWGANNLIVARNGTTINGVAENITCQVTGITFSLRYNGATWRFSGSAGARDGTALTEADPQTVTNKTMNFALNTVTVDGTNAPGFLGVPFVAEVTVATVLDASHKGKCVPIGAGGSIEIPNNIFAAGDAVLLFNNTGANVTITCTITTAYRAGDDTDQATIMLAPRGIATILFAGATSCVVSGSVS